MNSLIVLILDIKISFLQNYYFLKLRKFILKNLRKKTKTKIKKNFKLKKFLFLIQFFKTF
jgi:hypothetical protein